MKKFFNWQVMFGLVLLALSVIFYILHYLIFRDVHHIFLYLIGDIGFLYFDVLIVMLVLHRLLVYRDKQSLLRKLNMVIGAFYSEVGIVLMKKFSKYDPEAGRISGYLKVEKEWSDREFLNVRNVIRKHDTEMKAPKEELKELKAFLSEKRQFMLNLLINPNILEHESFTDLLWAVFHLTDELQHRGDLNTLPETDQKHLLGDMKRVYSQIIIQWIDYMKHLKQDYPYLFSLAMRTNPFDANASVEVT